MEGSAFKFGVALLLAGGLVCERGGIYDASPFLGWSVIKLDNVLYWALGYIIGT